jgi:hypothetical protein
VCISGCLCVGVSGVIFSVLQTTEFVGRLIKDRKRKHEKEMAELERLTMDKKRKYEEETAELELLWRMCAAQEQSCATHQGTRDGVDVPEGEPKRNRVWQRLLYTNAVFFF